MKKYLYSNVLTVLTDDFKLAEQLSDSYSSDARLSDIPDKENLFQTCDVRIRRKNKRFFSDNEASICDADKGQPCNLIFNYF
jgi:hypothetical protein